MIGIEPVIVPAQVGDSGGQSHDFIKGGRRMAREAQCQKGKGKNNRAHDCDFRFGVCEDGTTDVVVACGRRWFLHAESSKAGLALRAVQNRSSETPAW